MVGSRRKTRKMTNSEENRSRIEKKEKAKTLWIQALKIGKEDKIESKRLDKI